MSGEKNLARILKNMKPVLQDGEYVFCTSKQPVQTAPENILMSFTEAEGLTLILRKEMADELGLSYSYVAKWITLTVHSSLEAAGFTAAFSKALADHNISCNVVAAYYHDHLFVDKREANKALEILLGLSKDP